MTDEIADAIEATLAQTRRSVDTASLTDEVEQLSNLGAVAIAPLIQAMRVETAPGASLTLAKALTSYGRPAWEQLLEAARADDRSPFGRTLTHAIPRFSQRLEVEDFIAALDHPSPHVRWSAAKTLMGFPDPRAVEPLIALLSDVGPDGRRDAAWDVPCDVYAAVRSFAALALGMCGELAVPALLIALESPYPLTRAGAARALCGTKLAETLDPLLRAVNDPESVVRVAAIQSLARLILHIEGIQRDSVLELLLNLIRDGDRRTAVIAGQSLACLGALAIDPLCELAVKQLARDDSDDALYGVLHAFLVLLQLPQSREARPRIVHLLRDVLQSPNRPFFIRRVAVEGLKLAHSPQAVALLIATAQRDINPDLRLAAAQSLQTLRDTSALPALQDALEMIDTQIMRDDDQASEATMRVRHAVANAIESLEKLRDFPSLTDR